MRISLSKQALTFGVISLLTVAALILAPSLVSAQNSGSSCNPPSFQITSSKDISAIAGESFTYFVVTENNTPFSLSGQLPSGLSFSNNQISGTPQTAGDYTLRFVSSDGCQTAQTVNLSVIGGNSGSQTTNTDTSQGGGQQSAQQNTGQTEGGDQVAQAQGSVGLNEIPDTGLSADQALTVGFYALALMLLAYAGVKRYTPALAADTPQASNRSSDIPAANSQSVESTDNKSAKQSTRHIGDGIV
jgi:hypothetical protein